MSMRRVIAIDDRTAASDEFGVGRQFLLLELTLAMSRGAQVELHDRGGSKYDLRPPIIISERHIQFGTGHSGKVVKVRFDQIQRLMATAAGP